MCKMCVREPFVPRGSIALDSGAYLMNYRGCAKCQLYDFPHADTLEKVVSTEETTNELNHTAPHSNAPKHEETVTFEHVCKQCGHQISTHSFEFRIERDGSHFYSMECNLCGVGGTD